MWRVLWLPLLALLAFGNSAATQETDAFRLDAEISETQPYVGQPIVYTVRFFSRQEAANAAFIEPDFTGFGRSATTFPPTSSPETIDGVPFIVTIQQIALIPLRPGEFTIEPFRVEIPETPFQQADRLETQPFTLTVRSLPGEAPEDYNNAIGQFQVEAASSSAETTVGEAITLSLTITGTGNLEQITAPELSLPPAWRSFPAETTLDQETPIFGSKTFRWTLIPTLNGPQVVPPISFTSFNPQSGRYETRQTSLITIRVIGQPLPAVPDVQQTASPVPTTSAVTPPPSEALPLMPLAPGLPPIAPPTFWLLWIVPPFVLTVAWWFKHRQRRPVLPKTIRGSRAMTETLQAFDDAQALNPRAAYQRVATALLAYLSAKSGRRATSDDLPTLAPPVARDVQVLLEEAESGQYAPITENDKAELIERARDLLNRLESTWQE